MFLLLAGCGGSSSSSSSNPSVTRYPSPTSTSAAVTTTATSSTGVTSGGESSRSPTGGAPLTTQTRTSATVQSARVPATFTISAGGALSPSAVSSPAFIALQLTVNSGDGHSHLVVVHLPRPVTLHVASGRRAQTMVAGLRSGRYPISVDGRVRGALLIGGEPGP